MKIAESLTETDEDPAVLADAADSTDADAEQAPPLYKMQDLMQQIAEQSDLKRSDLREAAGLVCAAIGQALEQERVLSLPGLGKITPRKRDSKPGGDILTARIKLVKQALDSDEDAGENL